MTNHDRAMYVAEAEVDALKMAAPVGDDTAAALRDLFVIITEAALDAATRDIERRMVQPSAERTPA